MDNWLIFLGGMTAMCGCAALLAAFGDWLQRKLDEFNKWDDERREQQQLNNNEQ